MNLKTCPCCEQEYPATRDHFPPHKELAFKDRPCKACRSKDYYKAAKPARQKLYRKQRDQRYELSIALQKPSSDPHIQELQAIQNSFSDFVSPLDRKQRVLKSLRVTDYQGKLIPKRQACKLWLTLHPEYLDKSLDAIMHAVADECIKTGDLFYASRSTFLRAIKELQTIS